MSEPILQRFASTVFAPLNRWAWRQQERRNRAIFLRKMPWTMEHLQPHLKQVRFSDETFLLEFKNYYVEIARWRSVLEFRFSPSATPHEWFWIQTIEKFIANRRSGRQSLPVVLSSLESLDKFLMSCHRDIEESFSEEYVKETTLKMQELVRSDNFKKAPRL